MPTAGCLLDMVAAAEQILLEVTELQLLGGLGVQQLIELIQGGNAQHPVYVQFWPDALEIQHLVLFDPGVSMGPVA